mmetsp:Transcript_4550/g.12093  ORF Transcript_4550/g.12093 Transcript_4550/m.12093 type:complete len:311 (+) Transcript_4550:622-1554(+)
MGVAEHVHVGPKARHPLAEQVAADGLGQVWVEEEPLLGQQIESRQKVRKRYHLLHRHVDVVPRSDVPLARTVQPPVVHLVEILCECSAAVGRREAVGPPTRREIRDDLLDRRQRQIGDVGLGVEVGVVPGQQRHYPNGALTGVAAAVTWWGGGGRVLCPLSLPGQALGCGDDAHLVAHGEDVLELGSRVGELGVAAAAAAAAVAAASGVCWVAGGGGGVEDLIACDPYIVIAWYEEYVSEFLSEQLQCGPESGEAVADIAGHYNGVFLVGRLGEALHVLEVGTIVGVNITDGKDAHDLSKDARATRASRK